MKVLIYADPHFCQYSSIVRDNGDLYSKRLENLIRSLNWVEDTAVQNGCEVVVCAGDFFDKSTLNAQEITALGDLHFDRDIFHYFLCGNHEMGSKFHEYSSAKLFHIKGFHYFAISKAQCFSFDNKCKFLFIPYTLDYSKTMAQYVEENNQFSNDMPLVVISHNDLQINYGWYQSTNGFTIEDIENNCDLFFNGHLHNGSKITDKIINIGNLTGQNFSEDGFTYKHGVYIFNTETLSYKFIENPYAIYFYKCDFTGKEKQFYFDPTVKEKAITFTCYEEDCDMVKDFIEKNNVQYYKIQVKRKLDKETKSKEEEIQNVDHIQQFKDFVKENIGDDELTMSEFGYVTV